MEDLLSIAQEIASYEDAPMQPGRTTGAAGGGRNFEKLVAEQLLRFGQYLVKTVPYLELLKVKVRTDGSNSSLVLLDMAFAIRNKTRQRMLVFVLPALRGKLPASIVQETFPIPQGLLKREFPVAEWYEIRLAELRERGWIPGEDEGYKFGGSQYQELYVGKKTVFDGVAVLFEGGELREKILLEIKSLKSSDGESIDGNAHERFAYQNLDYLEIGSLYPKTSLFLFTNDAVLKYRNKYHTGFGVHALRLSHVFCWYRFEMVSSVQQYLRLFKSWKDWLEGR